MSASDDEKVRLYDAAAGAGRLALIDPDSAPRPCWSSALSSDGRSLIVGKGVQGEPGWITIWDPTTGRVRDVLRGHSNYIRAVVLAPDGRTLFSGDGDETILAWDLASGSEVAALEGHRGQVFCLAIDPTEGLLASGSEDFTVRIWDVAERLEAAVLRGHAAAVHSLAFTPDGTIRVGGATGPGGEEPRTDRARRRPRSTRTAHRPSRGPPRSVAAPVTITDRSRAVSARLPTGNFFSRRGCPGSLFRDEGVQGLQRRRPEEAFLRCVLSATLYQPGP